MHFNIEKGTNFLEVIIAPLQMIYGYFFSTTLSFLKIWFNRTSNIKLRLFVILIVSLLLSLHKRLKTPDHHEAIRNCSRYQFFTFDYIDNCEDIQKLITQQTIDHYSISKLKYKI